MATLAELLGDGRIHRWQVDLTSRQQPQRTICLLPILGERLGVDLAEGSTWNLDVTPEQQLDALTADFVAGEPLAFGLQFKSLRHHADGIWYLKTADVRLFGGFHAKDCFLAATCALAENVKRYKLYRPIGEEAARLIAALELDEPKTILGDDPNDVVSNFTYPG